MLLAYQAAKNLINLLLFWVLQALCWVVNLGTRLFELFSGLKKVGFQGRNNYLMNVFFQNATIQNIYWGMALVGIALTFAFAIFAVVRKMFDANGKVQASLGMILTETIKSIFLILAMSAVVSISLTGVDVLMRQINYLFQDADGLSQNQTIEFTDAQLQSMSRALMVISNYGKNPSYNSRYNINDCFNAIRPELLYLKNEKVFDYSYPRSKTDANGKVAEVNTWQSVLQDIANSADLRTELMADVYYENVMETVIRAIRVMQTDANFKPLQKLERTSRGIGDEIPLDRIVFLTGSLGAANNGQYNEKPSFTDALRRPYYDGTWSLYNETRTVNGKIEKYSAKDQLKKDFNLDFDSFDYLPSFLLGVAVLFSLFKILLNLVARIFSIVFLYLISPLVLSVRPLDSGKTKQWLILFVVQAVGVLGYVITMRLVMIFIPIIYDPTLIILDNSVLNYLVKGVMTFAVFQAALKTDSILASILSDTSGMAAAGLSNISDTAKGFLTDVKKYGMNTGSAGLSITGAVGRIGMGAAKIAGGMTVGAASIGASAAKAVLGGGRGGESASKLPQPVPKSSAPTDLDVGRKSATVAGRVKGYESARSAAPEGGGGAPLPVPEGGFQIPEAPAMPKEPYRAPDPDAARRQERMRLNRETGAEHRKDPQARQALDRKAVLNTRTASERENISRRAGQIEDRRREAAQREAAAQRGPSVPVEGGVVPQAPGKNEHQNRANLLEYDRRYAAGEQNKKDAENGPSTPVAGGVVPQAPGKNTIQNRANVLEYDRRSSAGEQNKKDAENGPSTPIAGGVVPQVPSKNTIQNRANVLEYDRRSAAWEQNKKDAEQPAGGGKPTKGGSVPETPEQRRRRERQRQIDNFFRQKYERNNDRDRFTGE